MNFRNINNFNSQCSIDVWKMTENFFFFVVVVGSCSKMLYSIYYTPIMDLLLNYTHVPSAILLRTFYCNYEQDVNLENL